MNKESIRRTWRIIKRKKWPVAVAVILIIAIIAAPITANAYLNHERLKVKSPVQLSEVFIKKTDREKITLVAHRGFSCQAPENTVPAIEKAHRYGYGIAEFDIQLTADGVWVVSHDETLNAMTNKNGKIANYTYYDIVTYNINAGANHDKYDNLKIPTLEQMLKACLENNVRPMIEVKNYTDIALRNLIELIDKNGFTNSCSIISFDRDVLKKVQKRNKDIQLYYLVDKLSKKEMDTILTDTSIGVSFNGHRNVNNESKIKKLSDAGVPLVCWTVDDSETMQKYYKAGITTFVTNKIFDK